MKSLKSLANDYFSKRTLPYWSILLMDCMFIVAAGFASYCINHGTTYSLSMFWPLIGTLCVYLVCFIVAFRLFHTYSGVIRYSSFIDLQRVGLAVICGVVFVLVLQWAFTLNRWLPELIVADLVLLGLIAIALMWASRIWVKTLYDGVTRAKSSVRCFIYGVREGGVALAKDLKAQTNSKYKIVGFITDCEDIVNKQLLGAKVYPNNDKLVDHMRKAGADTLVVSPYKTDLLRNNEEMVSALIDNNIKIMIFSRGKEWDGKSDLKISELKEVNVEDLLPRDKIEIDMESVGQLLRGRRILITGAAGSIGSEMVRQIAPYAPAELLLVDQAETPLHDMRLYMTREYPNVTTYTVVADISNKRRMEELFGEHNPEYVFHAAAYKHVPMMEDNPGESICNNVDGTRIIADLAVKYGTKKFVMVSTDKAVNPTNVMGASKRICEIYVQALDKAIKEGRVKGSTQFVTTRFGNVLGSNGSVIPLFKEQIKRGGPVTVTHPDIIRYFMLIPEACRLVLEAGTMGNGGEIYVFDMGKPVKIADLARRMIKMSGAKDIEIRFTGLRDGEKLYEEVLNERELTLPTFHPKIKIAKVREYDYKDVAVNVGKLVDMACDDDMRIVAMMKYIVPEFKSQHSRYEVLDKAMDKIQA